MTGTMRITAMVVFILIGSRVFSLVFQGVDGAKWIEHLLSDLPGEEGRLELVTFAERLRGDNATIGSSGPGRVRERFPPLRAGPPRLG